MRIAISALSVKPDKTGGGETVLRHLLGHLPSSSVGVEFIVFVNKENEHLFNFNTGVSNFSLQLVSTWVNSPVKRLIYETFVLPYAVKGLNVDLFFAINQAFSPLFTCPVVIYVQNLLYYHYREFYSKVDMGVRQRVGMELRNLYYSKMNYFAIQRAVGAIAVSETARQEVIFRYGLPADKIRVVPLGANDGIGVSAGDPPPHIIADHKLTYGSYFLMVGALEPYKNIDLAIRAIARLKTGRTGASSLVLVGLPKNDYQHILRQISIDLDVAERVVFVGAVPHEKIGGWYNQAEALLMLSGCEAFGLPPLEAMARGVPVIASDLSSIPEVVGSGGVIINPYDIDQLAGAMNEVVVDTGWRDVVIERGRNWVQRYSWKQMAIEVARQLQDIYESYYITRHRKTEEWLEEK